MMLSILIAFCLNFAGISPQNNPPPIPDNPGSGAYFSENGDYKLIDCHVYPAYPATYLYFRDSLLVRYYPKDGQLNPFMPGSFHWGKEFEGPTTYAELIEKYHLTQKPPRANFEDFTFAIELVSQEEGLVYGCSRDQEGHWCTIYWFENRIYLKDRLIHQRKYRSECTFQPEILRNDLMRYTAIWQDTINLTYFVYVYGELNKTVGY
ncbi:MAG: hypothetical protein H6581_12425 [Bacteroidia bacterium]|nr:hypothetical protein [Bacteroidia bacterium]